MKKFIQKAIDELKFIYPNMKISVQNGFIGIENGDRLNHTTYIGNTYYEIDGVIYTEYNCKAGSKKLMKI